MTKFQDGTDNVTSYGEVLHNDINRALRNTILSTGQAINNSDHFQVAKAMANYSAVSTFYTDSGIADAYILTSIDDFKGLTALINGAEVRFRAGNPNTGASTINVNGLGAVSIKQPDGVTNVIPNDIPTLCDTTLRYDSSNNVWTLFTISRIKGSADNGALIVSSGEITINTLQTIGVFLVDTEGAAPIDDLDTINAGKNGQVLIFRSTTQARDTTFKDGTGNLFLSGDFTLTNAADTIMLVSDDGNMYEISRSDNA